MAYSEVLSHNSPGGTLEKLQQFSRKSCSIFKRHLEST